MRPRRLWQTGSLMKSRPEHSYEMNISPVIHRYAKALLKLVQETGSGEKVYLQACVLVQRMRELPALSEAVRKHQELSLARRLELMEMALDVPLEKELSRFAALVRGHGRMELFERMLHSFIEQYRQANNIKVGHLVTASPISGLRERLQETLGESTHAKVVLEEDTDPDLLGGFVFELDGYRLDASVEGQLARIRRQIVEKNNRIV